MRLLRSFPVLAYAVMLLSIVGVSVAGRSAALLLVGGVLAALSWYVTEGPRGRSLPNWTANVLIVAVSLSVVIDLVQHHPERLGVLGRFVVLLVLIKLYQHKTPRDWAQLLGLSLLLMLIGCLQSNDLLFAGTLLAYFVLGLYVLLLFQLWAAYERHRSDLRMAVPDTGDSRFMPALSPMTGRRTALHLRGLMAGVVVAGLGLSVTLFVLFPRGLGEGMMSVPGGRQTGYSDEVSLTDGTRITLSRRVVMTVRTSGAPVFEPLRLRGAALDRYDGQGRWRASTLHLRSSFTTSPPGLTDLGDRSGPTQDVPGTVQQSIELLVRGSTLFTLRVPVAVGTERARQLRFDARQLVLEDAEPGALHRYTVRSVIAPSDALLRQLAGPTGGTDGSVLTREFNRLSESAKIRRLARDVLTGAGVPPTPPPTREAHWAWNERAAGVLTQYLQGGEFRYTLDLSDVQMRAGRDPIVQFLFESQRGHCEYFASALAAMCNTIGVPARIVTGYVTMEYDDRSDLFIVRESNAHAWVEVLTGPYRWRELDPTPPQALADTHGAPPTRSDRWRSVFDRFEARWSNNFVSFDGGSQQDLLDSLDFGWSKRVGAGLVAASEWAARVNRAFYLGPAGYIWMGIVATALIIAAVAVWTRWRRAARLRSTLRLEGLHGAAQGRYMRQLGFYLDMLQVLDRAGHGKPAWQPPLQFARRLAPQHPDGAAIVRRLSETFYKVRYGGRRLDREQVAEARKLVERLARVV